MTSRASWVTDASMTDTPMPRRSTCSQTIEQKQWTADWTLERATTANDGYANAAQVNLPKDSVVM